MDVLDQLCILYTPANQNYDFLISIHPAICNKSPKYVLDFQLKYIGLNMGNEPGEAMGCPTYAPSTLITESELREMSGENDNLGPAIGKVSEELANTVFAGNTHPFGNPIVYCFREIIRNPDFPNKYL